MKSQSRATRPPPPPAVPHRWVYLCVLFVVLIAIVYLLERVPNEHVPFDILLVLGSAIIFYGLIETLARRKHIEKQIPKIASLRWMSSFVQPARPRASTRDTSMGVSLERLPIAVVTLGIDGGILTANAAARKLLTLRRGEQVKFDDVVDGLGRSVGNWLESEMSRTGQHQPQMLRAKRAIDVYLQVSLAKTTGDADQGITAVLTDATELRSLEAQFVQSQKMQAIGQLVGGIAHDFNNLLTAISGYCDLLMIRHKRGDPTHNDLVQINNNANRAASLVGQLLAFSRKQTLQPSAVNVDDTVSEMTHLLSRLVGEKINLRFDRVKDLPNAFVDGRQLEQVVMNLVVNARDAMKDGGNIWIRTKEVVYDDDIREHKALVQAGRYVSIEVEDTGTGISKEIANKIFEPFISTKDVGEGTGLGLSTVYGIIKQTGGYVFAESEEGKGALFRVLLPVAAEELNIEQPEVKQIALSPTGLSQALVLLVEDEDAVRAFASRALKMQGVTLLEASSGEEALEIAAEYGDQIDVIVSDIVMPSMDGPTWVKAAQADCPSAKVIFVSGYSEESFEKQREGMKNCVYLPKPFSLQQLIETVDGVLR